MPIFGFNVHRDGTLIYLELVLYNSLRGNGTIGTWKEGSISLGIIAVYFSHFLFLFF